MTVQAIASSPEWQAKQLADAQLISDMQDQLNNHMSSKAEMLDAVIPGHISINGIPIVLTPGEKYLITMYAFIGLAEIVSATSTTSMLTIFTACVERAIHNLKKDGLLK